MNMQPQGLDSIGAPDTTVDVRETFGFDAKLKVPAFKQANEYVPDRDNAYLD